MSLLTPIESECDHALQCAKLMAIYQARAREQPIARRTYMYQASRMKKLIVASAIRVENCRQREIDRASA
jgi:hypothetical protein